MKKSLANAYRPSSFDEVTEQKEIITILKNQIKTNEIQHCYLFCGGAGTGKTSLARIFANEINQGEGVPVELDAASNNGVDDMRTLINESKTKPLGSRYKVFILDEVHMITTSGWNAILKLLEEPPSHVVFIMCTTDPQKIPATILSRVQRYNFAKISTMGIITRLNYICQNEKINVEDGVIEYIAKLSYGGMRDAITMLSKCMAYSDGQITVKNTVNIMGIVEYEYMWDLLYCLLNKQSVKLVDMLEDLNDSGKPVNEFVQHFITFVLDVSKLISGVAWNHVLIPSVYKEQYERILNGDTSRILMLLSELLNMNNTIKNAVSPMYIVESYLWLFTMEDR